MCTQLLFFSCMTTRLPFKIVKNNSSYIAVFFHSSNMTFMFSNGKTRNQLPFIIIQMLWVHFPHPHHQMQKIYTNHHHHCQCQHLQRICTRLLHHQWMSHPGHLKTTLKKVCFPKKRQKQKQKKTATRQYYAEIFMVLGAMSERNNNNNNPNCFSYMPALFE